ncbi:hypothetical protein [Adhaeribacter rhizoryzae]|uniref:Lipoprotein n=1 Tax=Adhaeribacter rhizoryzae TaxID=2607907 RepID=A0A5M6D1B8_9BACT|nr:hypothetical protein [Adhaeribacter rhizoryzae]KAA5540826.1 hypothetical protein F0145_22225 [Adhaeribacter rhizoryzae]
MINKLVLFLILFWLCSCSCQEEYVSNNRYLKISKLQNISFVNDWNNATIASLERQLYKGPKIEYERKRIPPYIQKIKNEESSLKYPSSRAQFLKRIFSYNKINTTDSVKTIFIFETVVPGERTNYERHLVLETRDNYQVYFASESSGWKPIKINLKEDFNPNKFFCKAEQASFQCVNNNSIYNYIIVTKIEKDLIKSEFIFSPCTEMEKSYHELFN